MMQKLSQWPTPLIRKWLLLAVIALACPAIGFIMLILNGDIVLLYMSIILAILTAAYCILLYRRIAREEYDVIEGVCISSKYYPLQQHRKLCLMTDAGEERTVILENKMVPDVGNRYRAYLISSLQQPQASPLVGKLGSPNAFAIEDLGENNEN